jgi:hypothetical protein
MNHRQQITQQPEIRAFGTFAPHISLSHKRGREGEAIPTKFVPILPSNNVQPLRRVVPCPVVETKDRTPAASCTVTVLLHEMVPFSLIEFDAEPPTIKVLAKATAPVSDTSTSEPAADVNEPRKDPLPTRIEVPGAVSASWLALQVMNSAETVNAAPPVREIAPHPQDRLFRVRGVSIAQSPVVGPAVNVSQSQT